MYNLFYVSSNKDNTYLQLKIRIVLHKTFNIINYNIKCFAYIIIYNICKIFNFKQSLTKPIINIENTINY